MLGSCFWSNSRGHTHSRVLEDHHFPWPKTSPSTQIPHNTYTTFAVYQACTVWFLTYYLGFCSMSYCVMFTAPQELGIPSAQHVPTENSSNVWSKLNVRIISPALTQNQTKLIIITSSVLGFLFANRFKTFNSITCNQAKFSAYSIRGRSAA